ncbi:MAG: hypothetical protein UX91_C0006G0008 [Candidatus Amesbacteria bacterium GW2011_GWB1_47_19]|nr:MAG: hypothetical protein UW51_C0002G0008 [Candidatus Amesbacteria bacterium GW2011_GWA1_44_24]KKU31402.1 MAG: hypothetical protein UX46_C0006G0194 [Candidatus Amesbacteria bacterium GW2011_GWC1_46_24]KKU66946.1 MAG: hypothetical protein UX91_C0006G0008 [Candidatus Amesbacteria bacterium GW2011_GWB1_47_19]
MLPWLILGLSLRLVLMPVTLHPDFRAVNFAADIIVHKGQILDFYNYLSRQPRTDPLVKLYGDGLFIYPPLAYLTHALFNFFLSPLYPHSAFNTLISDIGQLRSDPGLPFLLLLLKLPYLLADILCLLLIYRLLPDKLKISGSLLWIFNPVNIYVSYMIGQFDIFIALFLLLAVYLSKRKSLLAAVCIGLAAGFKPLPLFFLPLLPGPKLKNIIVGLLTYLVIIIPYLASSGFRQYALLAGLSDKIVYAKIMVSGSQFIPLFVLGLVLIYWWQWLKPGDLSLSGWFSALLLLFYSVTHFHPQWFVWVTPFLLLLYIRNPRLKFPTLIIMLSYLIIILGFEPSLHLGLFGINFSFFDWMNRFYPAGTAISIARGILAASGLFLVSQIRHPDSD